MTSSVSKVYNCYSCSLYVVVEGKRSDMNIDEVYRQHAEYCKGRIEQTIKSKEHDTK